MRVTILFCTCGERNIELSLENTLTLSLGIRYVRPAFRHTLACRPSEYVARRNKIHNIPVSSELRLLSTSSLAAWVLAEARPTGAATLRPQSASSSSHLSKTHDYVLWHPFWILLDELLNDCFRLSISLDVVTLEEGRVSRRGWW